MSHSHTSSIAVPLNGEVGGLLAEARVAHGSKRLHPDELGFFPAQPIRPGQTVSVSVSFPDANEGDLVIVQADDGGQIDGHSPVARLAIDSTKSVHFTFTSTEEGGVYRITLRNGFDEKRLQFETSEGSITTR